MGEIVKLRYPNKSHRKFVRLPRYSVKLSEFFGIMMGDGGINNNWQANISLNAIKDAKYALYVSKLCADLFGIVPAVRKRPTSQTTVISLASTTVVDFLVTQGLVRGNKLLYGLKIPKWILTKKSYRIACVRGLMDTDGGLYVHDHMVSGKQYHNIGLCFCSHSHELISQIAEILTAFGIHPHIEGWGQKIYLYKARDIKKYLKIFGTSNDRLSSVYNSWKSARVV